MKLRRLRCSFCRKDETDVKKLVAGPRVYICDECVAIANNLMSENNSDSSATIPTVWEKFSTRLGKVFRDLSTRRVDYFGAT